MSLLSLGLLPLAEIEQVPPDLLAQMGTRSFGPALGTLVSIDAVLVLSGAVLTSYVGVTGLIRRMSLDRCLPQFLLAENKQRGTNHWIILAFFAVCCSILVATEGEVTLLAGVYTISFLAVMALFAVGNMLLKVERSRLPRETRASWPLVVIAFTAVVLGLIGNVILDSNTVKVFAEYFVGASLIVAVMFLRVQLLRALLFVVKALVQKAEALNDFVGGFVRRTIEVINRRPVVYFTHSADPAELNRAALYVLTNEQTRFLKVVCVYEKEEDIPPDLAKNLTTIDHLYPNLRIDFLSVQGTFGPAIIEALSERLDVPLNYMFIGTLGETFPHRIEELGGVRLIL